ncbi:hypothetical protein BH20ACT6_BH20ACT6_17490 [soil metagenome]
MGEDELARMPGFGPTTARWLVGIGIDSYADIDALGSLEVYRRLQASRPGVGLNAPWALECLLLGCHWRDLPDSRKAELRRELEDGGARSPGSRG